LRSYFPQLSWPTFQGSIESIYPNEEKLTADPFPVQMKKIMDYCEEVVKDYGNQVKKILKVKDPDTYFSQACSSVKLQFFEFRPLSFAELPAVDGSINFYLDSGYFYLASSPYRKTLTESEEASLQYEKSIFGLVKIPHRYNEFLMQFLLLLSLGFNIFILVGMKGKQ
jgi:hypothetical protein